MTVIDRVYVPISFKKRGGAYRGSVSLKHLAMLQDDPAETMSAATDIYVSTLREIKNWQSQVRELRSSKKALPARKAWDLGDIVYRMNTDLSERGCRLESVYDHLQRHAGLSPKWLGKFVTLRRYVEDSVNIPSELSWNRIRDSAKSFGRTISGKHDESSMSWPETNGQDVVQFRFQE